ncbi:hypothetical protein BHE74_00036051 [Ensete ventricosum]|uniref:Uncharacterized protein n=1 Tax=Ensete ventricosum TaxID=4639 RepID=A0A444FFY1_ENSVE|nr:hypothetical protein GW17_00014308 [Ensete ventricosum]RWW57174.1 hypothetical protein BHE74_00036051 [Ensete ventricosum]RZR72440.1 hypothetical protein BHM03_00013439 [Ensete ventricosum]
MHRVDAVGNPLGVRRELAEGIGSLLGWRKGVRQKKIETHWKIIGGSRKVYRDERRVYRHCAGFRVADNDWPGQSGRLNRLYPGIWVLSTVDPPRTDGITTHHHPVTTVDIGPQEQDMPTIGAMREPHEELQIKTQRRGAQP